MVARTTRRNAALHRDIVYFTNFATIMIFNNKNYMLFMMQKNPGARLAGVQTLFELEVYERTTMTEHFAWRTTVLAFEPSR